MGNCLKRETGLDPNETWDDEWLRSKNESCMIDISPQMTLTTPDQIKVKTPSAHKSGSSTKPGLRYIGDYNKDHSKRGQSVPMTPEEEKEAERKSAYLAKIRFIKQQKNIKDEPPFRENQNANNTSRKLIFKKKRHDDTQATEIKKIPITEIVKTHSEFDLYRIKFINKTPGGCCIKAKEKNILPMTSNGTAMDQTATRMIDDNKQQLTKPPSYRVTDDNGNLYDVIEQGQGQGQLPGEIFHLNAKHFENPIKTTIDGSARIREIYLTECDGMLRALKKTLQIIERPMILKSHVTNQQKEIPGIILPLKEKPAQKKELQFKKKKITPHNLQQIDLITQNQNKLEHNLENDPHTIYRLRYIDSNASIDPEYVLVPISLKTNELPNTKVMTVNTPAKRKHDGIDTIREIFLHFDPAKKGIFTLVPKVNLGEPEKIEREIKIIPSPMNKKDETKIAPPVKKLIFTKKTPVRPEKMFNCVPVKNAIEIEQSPENLLPIYRIKYLHKNKKSLHGQDDFILKLPVYYPPGKASIDATIGVLYNPLTINEPLDGKRGVKEIYIKEYPKEEFRIEEPPKADIPQQKEIILDLSEKEIVDVTNTKMAMPVRFRAHPTNPEDSQEKNKILDSVAPEDIEQRCAPKNIKKNNSREIPPGKVASDVVSEPKMRKERPFAEEEQKDSMGQIMKAKVTSTEGPQSAREVTPPLKINPGENEIAQPEKGILIDDQLVQPHFPLKVRKLPEETRKSNNQQKDYIEKITSKEAQKCNHEISEIAAQVPKGIYKEDLPNTPHLPLKGTPTAENEKILIEFSEKSSPPMEIPKTEKAPTIPFKKTKPDLQKPAVEELMVKKELPKGIAVGDQDFDYNVCLATKLRTSSAELIEIKHNTIPMAESAKLPKEKELERLADSRRWKKVPIQNVVTEEEKPQETRNSISEVANSGKKVTKVRIVRKSKGNTATEKQEGQQEKRRTVELKAVQKGPTKNIEDNDNEVEEDFKSVQVKGSAKNIQVNVKKEEKQNVDNADLNVGLEDDIFKFGDLL